MDFRSVLDQVKQAFVIGKDNPFLHGGRRTTAEHQPREEQEYQPPQQNYAQGYNQPQHNYAAYQQPYAPYQQPVQQAYQQPQPQPYGAPYQQPQQQPYAPYQQPQQAWPQQEEPEAPQQSFESQFNPEPLRSQGRNRRSQQQRDPQPQPQAAPENLVPFPGHQQQEVRTVDTYVINVFNINSCRQAMSCLRKGQCTLIVMDQLVDKAEIRRYVDMLTGACYALNGTMTRLSAKIGFYIMAPNGMTVYTDPVTSSANAQPKPQAAYQASTQPGAMPEPRPYNYAPQAGYGAVAQTNFQQNQPQQPAAPYQAEGYRQPPQQEQYAPYRTERSPYAANS